MSLSSGAYFGSHSTVSQGRDASALPVSRLVWIGPLSRTRTAGRAARPGCGPKAVVDPAEERHEVGAALGLRGVHDQLPRHGVLASRSWPPSWPALAPGPAGRRRVWPKHGRGRDG
jgi:hypothetical protein